MSGERQDLLIEVGTEELPPKALRTLELAFASHFRAGLEQAGLKFGALESFATPRRLALLVRRLTLQQPAQQIKRRGPPVKVSFDASGAPTRAATAFAAGCGIAVESLGREQDAKGNDYLAYEGSKPGSDTRELLQPLLQQALDALPVPKRMRWGAGEAQFVRPVHWLIVLFGREVVPMTLLDTASDAFTQGHRFMSSKPIRISSPGGYVNALLSRGKVIASFEARRGNLRTQVEAIAAGLGGQAIIADALLDEVTALVEWPVALAGQFEPRYLDLPREVLISTLQEHQRYFAVQAADGALLPWFITVSNIDSPQPELVRAGNERVVRPRLADAAFFWNQDRRSPLSARRPGLDAVTFQVQLGSLGARTDRIAHLASTIAAAMGADVSATARAALLAKCDLLTAMVGEFPELQGIMGRYYALADGEPNVVANAVAEHYLPRGAGDALPSSPVSDALALADKLDALTGIFAVGQKPSGTRDPFALRRAAIGILRIVLEHRLELDLKALIETAVRAQPLTDLDSRAEQIAVEVYDYVFERLRAQYLERSADSGITTEMFDAVLETRPGSVLDFDARLRALVGFLGRSEGASLAADNKRIANILRKSASAVAQNVDSALLREAPEQDLHRSLVGLRQSALDSVQRRDYSQALSTLAGLRPTVHAFFDNVLVNDPDQSLRNNRFALLAEVRALFGAIADLSRLPG